MNTYRTLFLMTLLLATCSAGADGQNDSELRRRLTGAWATEDFTLDTGVRTGTGMWTISTNGSFRREWTNAFSVSVVQRVTSEGTVQVKDGFLIETITNVVAHGRPESEQNILPDGGVTGRTRIIRLDNRELVIETNAVFGRRVHKRIVR
jgi:hypothetical protein